MERRRLSHNLKATRPSTEPIQVTSNGRQTAEAPLGTRVSRVALLPWMVLAVGIAASFGMSVWQQNDYERSREERMRTETTEITDSLLSSVAEYEELNESIAQTARPADGSRSTQADFAVFVDALVLPSNFPGTFGLAWADSVPSSQLLALMADESVPVASLQELRPDGEEEQSIVVTMGGPDATMAIARGVDTRVYEPISETLDRALIANTVQASAPFALPLQEGPDKENPPVVVFLARPYFRADADMTSPQGRLEGADGFAGTILDMGKFLPLAGGPLQNRYAMTVTDVQSGEPLASTDMVPRVGGGRISDTVEVYGRGWRVDYAEATNVAYGEKNLALSTLLGGLAVTFFVFVVVFVISRSERRAQRLVQQATAELSLRASTDSLTELANRSELVSRLDAALASEDPDTAPTVFFVDLDGFKLVNDSLGHSAGDEMLVQVADRLRRAVRPADTIARFGGDEFVVLTTDVAIDSDATEVAERLQGALEEPFHIAGRELFVSSSIGIARVPDGGRSGEELICNADAAMYAAKEMGVGRHAIYEPGVHNAAMEHLTLLTELRHAMERGQLDIEYQPQYELDTGRLSGLESLMRWRHPRLGSVSPEVFIPLAEQSGLIHRIGNWAIEDACSQGARWRRLAGGTSIPVSVNVSVAQLVGNELEAEIEAALARHDMAPTALCLEVTEGALIDDFAEVIGRLERLRTIGVRVAVDDFGTGYSSLAQIRRLPVDVLKIDRSFIAGVAEDERDQAVVRAVVDLAHALGMTTVAEGIETEAQRDTAWRLGVDHAQGWFWQRSMSVSGIDELVTAARRQVQGTR